MAEHSEGDGTTLALYAKKLVEEAKEHLDPLEPIQLFQRHQEEVNARYSAARDRLSRAPLDTDEEEQARAEEQAAFRARKTLMAHWAAEGPREQSQHREHIEAVRRTLIDVVERMVPLIGIDRFQSVFSPSELSSLPSDDPTERISSAIPEAESGPSRDATLLTGTSEAQNASETNKASLPTSTTPAQGDDQKPSDKQASFSVQATSISHISPAYMSPYAAQSPAAVQNEHEAAEQQTNHLNTPESRSESAETRPQRLWSSATPSLSPLPEVTPGCNDQASRRKKKRSSAATDDAQSAKKRPRWRSADTSLRFEGLRGTAVDEIDFDEVWANGNPKYPCWIEHNDQGQYYIYRCDQHGVMFRENPIQGAAKHLRSKAHNVEGNIQTAFDRLSIQVLNCWDELMEKHNAMVSKKLKDGSYVPPKGDRTAAKDMIELWNTNNPGRGETPPPQSLVPAVAAGNEGDEGPSIQPATPRARINRNRAPVITPGEVYKGYCGSSWRLVVALPIGSLEQVGLGGSLEDTGLLDVLPEGVTFDHMTGEFSRASSSAEDERVRLYPIMHFNGDPFPEGSDVNVLEIEDLELFDRNASEVTQDFYLSTALQYIEHREMRKGATPSATEKITRSDKLNSAILSTQPEAIAYPAQVDTTAALERHETPDVEGPRVNLATIEPTDSTTWANVESPARDALGEVQDSSEDMPEETFSDKDIGLAGKQAQIFSGIGTSNSRNSNYGLMTPDSEMPLPNKALCSPSTPGPRLSPGSDNDSCEDKIVVQSPFHRAPIRNSYEASSQESSGRKARRSYPFPRSRPPSVLRRTSGGYQSRQRHSTEQQEQQATSSVGLMESPNRKLPPGTETPRGARKGAKKAHPQPGSPSSSDGTIDESVMYTDAARPAG